MISVVLYVRYIPLVVIQNLVISILPVRERSDFFDARSSPIGENIFNVGVVVNVELHVNWYGRKLPTLERLATLFQHQFVLQNGDEE